VKSGIEMDFGYGLYYNAMSDSMALDGRMVGE
jgi:hypothetical protein